MDELLVVVDGSVNDSIADGLGDDVFSLFSGAEHELNSDIFQRDLGVRNIDLLEAELDDGVSQALDEGQVVISRKHILVL